MTDKAIEGTGILKRLGAVGSPVERGVGRLVPERASACGLTECHGKPMCPRCVRMADMDALCALLPEGVHWGDPLTPELLRTLLPKQIPNEFGHLLTHNTPTGKWNPLEDDGDALRLALVLGLSFEPYPIYNTEKHSVIVKQRRRSDQLRESNPTECIERYQGDPMGATRRAIVRAAAAVAEQGVLGAA